MVGFHAAQKQENTVSRTEGAAKQDRHYLEVSQGIAFTPSLARASGQIARLRLQPVADIAARSSLFLNTLRQLGDVARDPARLVAGERLGS